MFGRSHFRIVLAMAFALVALGSLTAPATAYSVVGSTGTYGMYVVTDTQTKPGAHCYYHNASAADQDMYQIKIPAPRIFATDRTGGRDKQKVGWKYLIQHGTSVGSAPNGWVTSYTSSIVKGNAYDDQAAPFTYRIWPASPPINRWWRVQLQMYWYHPGSSTTVDGKVTVLIDYYKITYPPGPDTWNPMDCIPEE